MTLERLFQGRNSVLYNFDSGSVLYEKLSNTLHAGKRRKLEDLQKKIEEINYRPEFESETLKGKVGEGIENLVFNVTERCNFNCGYCIFSGNYENERIENNLEMDISTAKRAIDLLVLRTRNPALISFYGGEPLNNIDLINEIIKYAKENYSNKVYAFSMTSNFYNADRYLREIIENEIHINISLDGPEEIHNKNRKLKDGRPTYDKIMKNLGKFEEVAPGYVKKHFRYNITCASSEDLPRIIKFFQKNKQFTGARISMVEQKGFKDRVDKRKDNGYVWILANDYVNSILSGENPGILKGFFDQPLKRIAFRREEIMPERLMLEGSCYPGNRKLFVDTNGTFYICERFGRRIPIGDAENGINQKLIDNVIENFREIRNELCTDCWAQRICTPCIQSSKDSGKDISKKGLFQTCNSNKSQILVALTQYVSLSEKKEKLENYIKSIKP